MGRGEGASGSIPRQVGRAVSGRLGQAPSDGVADEVLIMQSLVWFPSSTLGEDEDAVSLVD